MYQSNLSDEEWELIEYFFQKKDSRGWYYDDAENGLIDGLCHCIRTGPHVRKRQESNRLYASIPISIAL